MCRRRGMLIDAFFVDSFWDYHDADVAFDFQERRSP
jgi:hypothetical protein